MRCIIHTKIFRGLLSGLGCLMVLGLVQPAWAVPKIAVDTETIDFGSVAQGEPAKFEFTLRNEGDTPLKIDSVKPQCGCTTAPLSNDVIEPGGTATINGSVRTVGFHDRISKNITVNTDDPKTPQLQLRVTGLVTVPFLLEPRYVNFSRIPVGEGGSRTVTLTVEDESRLPVKFQDPVSTNPAVSATVAPHEGQGDPAKVFDINVTVASDAERGVISVPLQIPVEGMAAPLQLTVYADVVGSVALYPSTVNLGLMTKDTPVVRKFIVMSPTGGTFTVKSASCNLPGCTVETESLGDDGQKVRLTVTVDPSGLDAGRVDAILTVKTDSSDSPELTAQLTGSLRDM